MIAAMLDFDERRESVLIVVIESDNLVRMKRGDPATLESVNSGGVLPVPKYPHNLGVLIAHEEDDAELYRRARGNPLDFLRWLERGRRFIKGLDGTENAFSLRKKP